MSKSDQNKIIWFLLGNPAFTASSRIHGLAVHNKLVELGYNSFLAYVPTYAEESIPLTDSNRDSLSTLIKLGDIVILQKIKNLSNLNTIDYFKRIGLTVILIDCDLPVAVEVGQVANALVCMSKALTTYYLKLGVKATFIEDSPELYSHKIRKEENSKLKCFWFGDSSDKRWNEVLTLNEIINDPRLTNWELVTVSNHPDATVQWGTDFLKVMDEEADIVALPIFNLNEENSVKSANRLVQSMALSLPVVCSPLPSYLDIAALGKGVIICKTREEWVEALLLLQDAKLRKGMSKEAFEAAQPFNLNHVIHLWVKALKLTEKFKIESNTEHEKVQRQINVLFYTQLIRKNIKYFVRIPLSVGSMASAFFYLRSKSISIARSILSR
ncbi:MAG: glycosyltransferase [Cyclobacteriaceae bacterium]